MSKTRDSLIDILKGIGIVSVVIGHSGVLFPGGDFIPSTRFVYLYHLMLFFFTAGAVYSPEKYSDPYVYIGRQMKGSVPMYWAYNFAFLALHNVFSSTGMLDIPKFSLIDYVIKIPSVLTLMHVEQLPGAVWFVPVLLLGKFLFAVAFNIAEKTPCKVLAHGVFFSGFAILGIYTNYWGMYFSYCAQTAFLGVPVIYLGYLFRNYREYVMKFANIFTCIASAAIMVLVLGLDIGYIELSSNQIITPVLFYPVTILGIFFAIALASVIQHFAVTSKMFAYFGSISFHIMALHFLSFKCFDWVYGAIRGMLPTETMGFPTAFANAGLVYLTLGVALPSLIIYSFSKVKRWLQDGPHLWCLKVKNNKE